MDDLCKRSIVSLPGTAQAAGKVTLAEMVKIKKAVDEAAQSAKAQAKKAKTAEEKRLAKQLVKQAEINAENAEVAGELLEAVKAGEEVSREEAEACAAIAKAVHEATGAEMQRADGAGKPPVVTQCIMPPIFFPPVTPRKTAYCENNNIIRPDGSVFASCGEKICEETPYGAMCVPRVSPSSAQGLPWINPFK